MEKSISVQLHSELTSCIQDWMDKKSGDDEWAQVGWMGKNAAYDMATAAMSVLNAISEANEYIQDQGLLK